MTENMKIEREHRRLETNVHVPPVDGNPYVRTLRNRKIQYDIGNRQFDTQNGKGQNPNIPDITTQAQCSRNIPIHNTFRQEYTPTLTIRQNGSIRQEKLSNPKWVKVLI